MARTHYEQLTSVGWFSPCACYCMVLSYPISILLSLPSIFGPGTTADDVIKPATYVLRIVPWVETDTPCHDTKSMNHESNTTIYLYSNHVEIDSRDMCPLIWTNLPDKIIHNILCIQQLPYSGLYPWLLCLSVYYSWKSLFCDTLTNCATGKIPYIDLTTQLSYLVMVMFFVRR